MTSWKRPGASTSHGVALPASAVPPALPPALPRAATRQGVAVSGGRADGRL